MKYWKCLSEKSISKFFVGGFLSLFFSFFLFGSDVSAKGSFTNYITSPAFNVAPGYASCGSSDGKSFPQTPEDNLCATGTLYWQDKEAIDGTYNWQCRGSFNYALCKAEKPQIPVPPSPKQCLSENTTVKTITFTGTGLNQWKHEVSYCDCDLSNVQISTARVSAVNGLTPVKVITKHNINFDALAEGTCDRRNAFSGRFPDGKAFTTYLSYCKVNGELQIKHDVPAASNTDYQVHGTVGLSCNIQKPLCSIGTDPVEINKGEGTALWWWTQDATSASIDNGIGSVSVPSGSRWITPQQTTTYTINVQGSGGSESCQTTVIVHDNPVAEKPLCSIGTDPVEINKGEGTALWWWTKDVTSASIDNGIGSVSVPSGSRWITPQQTTTYTINVQGSGGSESCQTTVTVNGY